MKQETCDEEKIYYKLVCNDLTSWACTGAAQVQYRIGEYVKAPLWLQKKGYYLFVFDTFENAAINVHKNVDKLFTCNIKNRIYDLPTILNWFDIKDKIMIKLDYCEWFPGTVMVKEVKLLEEIEYSKIWQENL